jgi:hypothetical protein
LLSTVLHQGRFVLWYLIWNRNVSLFYYDEVLLHMNTMKMIDILNYGFSYAQWYFRSSLKMFTAPSEIYSMSDTLLSTFFHWGMWDMVLLAWKLKNMVSLILLWRRAAWSQWKLMYELWFEVCTVMLPKVFDHITRDMQNLFADWYIAINIFSLR